MNEKELYKELGALTKDKSRWEESIPFVSSLLAHGSEKIRAKALWLSGEIGLKYPLPMQSAVPAVAAFLEDPSPLLRERAVIALGRIGRGSYPVMEEWWADLFRFAEDREPGVRLGFIWASENIAVNTPDIYEDHMQVYAGLLHDENDRVRREAPEFFRVVGKRRPDLVLPYEEELRRLSGTDTDPVVRVHCLGALKAAGLI